MTGGENELESVRVARVLRAEILHGDRAPGSRLVERDIAAELEVSRLPVREAIRMLVAEGVVVARPRSWAVVREFTAQDIQEFSEVREAVETLVFLLAAERHDEAGLAMLRAALDEEFAGAEADDEVRAQDAAGEFHVIVARLADNSMLNELLFGLVTRLRWLFGQHDDLLGMAEQHRTLFDAIARRDTELLRVEVPRHLDSGRQEALRRLAERSRAVG
ncbi:DNA-binding GntR family transcriptional regulator [Microbacterium resistens]|uniref:DNA-binding GntR family transcriptional regulator n=1 Tax=Microbacterium resistens TaxID=156977 RepID=A0ABU1SAF8_9MICO|nr:GntR family transcriptional regulator [Microbacterium resistens]MDR6866593.1 DNA-binding GntR family transcriptional regulator [Microbacterium resistens]